MNICQHTGIFIYDAFTYCTTIRVVPEIRSTFVGPLRKKCISLWPLRMSVNGMEAKALPNNKVKSNALFIYEHIIAHFGCPLVIVTNQGTHFINDVIRVLTKEPMIMNRKSTPKMQ